jgi:hypothetical protein
MCVYVGGKGDLWVIAQGAAWKGCFARGLLVEGCSSLASIALNIFGVGAGLAVVDGVTVAMPLIQALSQGLIDVPIILATMRDVRCGCPCGLLVMAAAAVAVALVVHMLSTR